jgi:tetratricopeptide (TPR) repeat protein
MSSFSNSAQPSGRLATLLKLLERDPNNLSLISDTAEVALQQNEPDVARELLDRFASQSALTARERNLRGLMLLQSGAFEEAARVFGELLEEGADDAGLRFNRAWCQAKLRRAEEAHELLHEEDLLQLPQAAMLRVHLLHEMGRLDEALSEAKRLVAIHPQNPGLLAAASVVAIDAEDLEFAGQCARDAPGNPDAMTTLGTIALAEDRTADAAALFGQALEKDPSLPRAIIGAGLGKMLTGNYPQAATDIERGAVIFGDHIGSWVAAGWAYIFSGDLAAARRCFETALAIDHNFGETHGSLAVLDLMEGRVDEARREAQTARRLNSQSFSAALAQAMLLSSGGRADQARAILDRALHTPLDASGRTIAQSLARHGLSL